MFKKWIKSFFYGNVKHIVWHKQVEYVKKWADAPTERDNFNYTIYYYPYRLNNQYQLVCSPQFIHFWPAKKKYADQFEFYPKAVEALRNLEKSSLIEILIQQD